MSEYRIYFNPHCANCEPAIEAMRQAVTALGRGTPALVNVLDDVDTAVRLRIAHVPALVCGQRLIAQGSVSRTQLEPLLLQQQKKGRD